MPVELTIPVVGESITEVQISEWLKSEGDLVKQDEAIAVIDSEKATLDLPAPQNGRLVKILHQAGETVAVGAVVAHLEAVGGAGKSEPVEKASSSKPASEAANSGEARAEKANPVEAENSKVDPDKKFAPKAAKAERVSNAEMKAPASKVPLAQKSSASREEEIVPMTMLRRTVARHLVEAQQTMAMLTTFNEVDMSAVQTLRKEHQEAFEKRYQVKLGLMSFFVKATIDALKQFPQLNAEVRGNDIVYRNYFDIGVAIATERGLVVPVLRNAERFSFAELEKAIGDFARRAKDGKLKPDELEGGTFTITNGGSFGSLLSTPIINPPQTGILGMHTIQERPVAVQGQVVIRPMMYLAVSYDHRIVDGREAVLFLRRIKEVIEMPSRMLIEI
jgi:2-oxoglutarate dehydrogenase E2 component (dihydrolipoamide succinyltransferase)